MPKLTKSQQEVWDRLEHGVPPESMDRTSWSYWTHKPNPAIAGSIYYNTDKSEMMVFDGHTWRAVQ